MGCGASVKSPDPVAPATQAGQAHVVKDEDAVLSVTADATGDDAVVSMIEAASPGRLRNRLQSLGRTFSIEVGPSDVEAPDDKPGAPRLLPLLAGAKSEGEEALLHRGASVFVNMVKPTMEHFADVVGACRALSGAGFAPVPHVPAARFESPGSFRETLEGLVHTGQALDVLVLGGNDLGDRREAGACHYVQGACQLLAEELVVLKAQGIKTVFLAGHPDGHPAVQGDSVVTSKLLTEKAELVFRAGLRVAVTTQFCFDARKLVCWLHKTRSALTALAADVLGKLDNDAGHAGARATFHIGVPGPTPTKKLERIAKICEVPSLFLSSAFDVLDVNGDGYLTLQGLQEAVDVLGLARKGSKLHSIYVSHAGADGHLAQDQFAQLLVEDALTRMGSKQSTVEDSAGIIEDLARIASAKPTAVGPSTQVNVGSAEGVGTAVATGVAPPVVWPEELVLALAAFCDSEGVQEREVVLHFYPFGGLARTLELTTKLREGSWPRLTGNDSS